MPPQFYRSRRWRQILLILASIYIAAIWIWFALRLLWFDGIWWLSLLNTFAFYLVVPSLVLLPIAIYRGWRDRVSKLEIVGLSLPFSLFVYFCGYLFVPPALKARSTGTNIDRIALRAMSFNLLFNNQNYSEIIGSIRAANPDLIGLQEVRSHHLTALKSALTEYPYVVLHPAPHFHNIAFFSRYPIASTTILPADSIERGIGAVVKIRGRSLMVITAHLTPNYVPPVPWPEYPDLLQARYRSRDREIDYLQQFIRSNPDPAIVLCDCNLTDTAQAYLQMSDGLVDSFARAGWGLGNTFQGEQWKIPLQRLDYIWHTDRVRSIDAYVGRDGGSDHLPIVADLQF